MPASPERPAGIPGSELPGRGRSATTRPRCASGCAPSRACRCSARCSRSRPGGRRCGSSCATARRAAVLDVAERLRRAGARAARPTGCRSSRPAAATTTPARAPPRPPSRSPSRGCGSPARATCWPSSRSCAARCTPRGCSSPEAAAPPGAAAHDRRRLRRARQGARRPARRARRRGWRGRVVWAFAPVQDRHAAPAITRALQDLAACAEVEAIVVARGGGSLADLFAFCDETLCRTVALLRVPVIASVGHHTDRTLLDDVAAVALLDADARRRGRRAVGLRRRPPGARRGRRAAGAPEPPRDRRARAHAGAALPRAGRPRGAAPRAPAPAPARAARERPPRAGRR